MPAVAKERVWTHSKAMVVGDAMTAEWLKRELRDWFVIPLFAALNGRGFDLVVVATPVDTLQKAEWLATTVRCRLMPGGQIIHTCRSEALPSA